MHQNQQNDQFSDVRFEQQKQERHKNPSVKKANLPPKGYTVLISTRSLPHTRSIAQKQHKAQSPSLLLRNEE